MGSTKQPKGLYLLFFTELWERFGFYTLQTILILYMTKSLGLPDQQANLLYATFNSLLYLTPTLGGFLADRYLGFQRAITIGGMILIVAYCVAALPGSHWFFLGLSILVCGNGLFKPNVSSIVGELYTEHDARRDSGFTLFYMGINLGALVPPLIAGGLVLHYGWHAGFMVAAIGMVIGQLVFFFGKKQLGTAGKSPKHQPTMSFSRKFYILLSSGIAIAILLCQLALCYPQTTNLLVECSAVAILGLLIFFLFKQSLADRKKMLASLILIIISVAFWALYNQTFCSMMLFADRHIDKHFLGMTLDAEATQFFNPFFILIFSPLLSRLWISMDNNGLNPSTQMKFTLGIFLMSIGYLTLSVGAHYFSHDGLVSPWWLCSSYLLQTIGELLISPIGLAMITVLCPKKLVGMMMGVWFFTQAAAFSIGGTLANIAAIPPHASIMESLAIYSHAFSIYGYISWAAAMISLALIPLLTRMINHKDEKLIYLDTEMTASEPT